MPPIEKSASQKFAYKRGDFFEVHIILTADTFLTALLLQVINKLVFKHRASPKIRIQYLKRPKAKWIPLPMDKKRTVQTS